MRRTFVPLLSLPFALAAQSVLLGAQASPPRGRALYELMGREQLLATEGSTQVRWLPDGNGWYTVDSSSVTTFNRVDPRNANARSTPLFDEKVSAQLLSQYQQLGGKSANGLPFREFEYALEGRAIFFDADDQRYLFELSSAKLTRLPKPRAVRVEEVEGLMRTLGTSQLVRGSYSPDFTRVAYVRGFDLYMMDARGNEVQLTSGGSEELMNGRPDWVYPEELGQNEGFFWSPDGKRIAYLQWDERAVARYPIVHELVVPSRLELQRYPKAGAPNPIVKLFVIDLQSGQTVDVETRSGGDVYIVNPVWRPDSKAITFQRLNRRQNVLQLMEADAATGTVRELVRETEPEFVNLHRDLRFVDGGKQFLWSSERSGWRHLYLYEADGRRLRPLTSGEWPVQRVVEEKNGWVFFTAARNGGLDSHLFKVKLDGSRLTQLTTEPGVHRVTIDPAGAYFTDTWSSLTSAPRTVLRSTEDGRSLRPLGSTNTTQLDALRLEVPESLTVRAADGVTELHGVLFRPAGFDASRKYPVVVSVYGGPHSQRVTNAFEVASAEQRLAQLGFMVWKMDNRGTPNRGKKFETATYLKLGQVDLDDQAAGVRHLARLRPFVDSTRVGIYGGSYGGYMSAMALLRKPDVFHAGVATSSVTDWRNYDSPYTERYMRTPQDNKEGYEAGSTLSYAKNLRGHLLIVHGTTDNNVHAANSIQLIQELVKEQKRFDVMFYPEQRHGIAAAGGQHLTRLRVDFLVEHLRPESATEKTASVTP